MDPLPTKTDGASDWLTIFRPEHIGRKWSATATQAKTAWTAASRYGFRISCHQIRPNRFEVTLTGRQTQKAPTSGLGASIYQAALKREADIPTRLREARETLAQWQGKKILSQNPADRTAAGVRVLIWKAQVAALEAQLPPAAPKPKSRAQVFSSTDH